MNVPFVKMQALGNDFVLIEQTWIVALAPALQSLFGGPSGWENEFLSELASSSCKRRFGIGADGLLVVKALSIDRLSLRMFNPDGTEDFCGNGIRCASAYAFQKGWVGRHFKVTHFGQEAAAEVTDEGAIRITLGQASFDPKDVPLAPGTDELFLSEIELAGTSLEISSLSTGTTHTIIFTNELPSDEYFMRISRALEHHPMFPDRTSVIWCKQTGHNELTVRIWERGVGETSACGTGSSAAAVTYMRKTGHTGEVRIVSKGGLTQVFADRWNGPISSQSELSQVFSGVYHFEMPADLASNNRIEEISHALADRSGRPCIQVDETDHT